MATGYVDVFGKMTDAEITDNNGFVKDRNRIFESEEEFVKWAKESAGIFW